MGGSTSRGPASTPNANCEAHLQLGMLMERAGIRKTELLARLWELGYEVSDDTFTNWGRKGRAFPRDWLLLRSLIGILSQPYLPRRCTAAEALQFFALTGLPICELEIVAALFPLEEFNQALVSYLPTGLIDWLTDQRQLTMLERSVP
jgi:hypothetical protein